MKGHAEESLNLKAENRKHCMRSGWEENKSRDLGCCKIIHKLDIRFLEGTESEQSLNQFEGILDEIFPNLTKTKQNYLFKKLSEHQVR